MRASVFALVLGAAACTHAPHDADARRAAVPAEVRRRAPEPGELRGAWISTTVRGALAGAGSTFVYVFADRGRYTGAAVSGDECVVLEGAYAYERRAGDATGTLRLDDDALRFDVSMAGDRLELYAGGSYLALRRLAAPPTPPEVTLSSDDAGVAQR